MVSLKRCLTFLIGLSKNNMAGLMDLWKQNLYPQYTMDCAQHDAPVPNFFTVFGVLFSGVTGKGL